MSGIYVVEAANIMRAAGLTVVESGHSAGWQTRARSSGGFPATPLGVQWHHTASKTSIESDLNWQINGCDDAPVGNATIARDGRVHMVAAGAANTAGKGGPITFSRGTVPLDSGNTRTWAFEVANNGVGEPWPQVQIDAFFTASNAMNASFGNQPDDVMTHNGYCEPSCPGRKIDPAVASAVQGPWRPHSINSSGTWNQTDVRNECLKRAGSAPQPTPPQPTEDDDMLFIGKRADGTVLVGNGVSALALGSDHLSTLEAQIGFGRWHHPHRSGYPSCTEVDDIVQFPDHQLFMLVGKW